MYPDLTFPTWCHALSSVEGDLVQVLSPAPCGGLREEECGSRRRILLVPVVRLDDLDIVVAELLGEIPHYLAEQVHSDAHVRGEHDGYVLRRFFDLRALLLAKPRGSDDYRFAVGEVLDSRIRRGELDEDLGVVGWIFGYGNTYLAGAAEFTEVGAEFGCSGLIGAAG